MNYKTIANVLGRLLIVTGSSMVFPLICSLYYKENDLNSIGITGIVTIAIGYLLWKLFRRDQDLNIKDGFFIAFFGSSASKVFISPSNFCISFLPKTNIGC